MQNGPFSGKLHNLTPFVVQLSFKQLKITTTSLMTAQNILH
jgi:hypothetical protein